MIRGRMMTEIQPIKKQQCIMSGNKVVSTSVGGGKCRVERGEHLRVLFGNPDPVERLSGVWVNRRYTV
ncbi:hypothetical protein J6590_035427 [Homalodisca vitripennis]|nr:hypothetical protein J6590_035427 [Homalodisca vitripennis]